MKRRNGQGLIKHVQIMLIDKLIKRGLITLGSCYHKIFTAFIKKYEIIINVKALYKIF